jgi:hypothetical protein
MRKRRAGGVTKDWHRFRRATHRGTPIDVPRRAILLLALTPIALILALLAITGLPSVPAKAPDSPQAALDAGLRAIKDGDLPGFRASLVPAVAAKAGPKELARCQEFLRAKPVRPGWEAAERTAVDNHVVVRVNVTADQKVALHQLSGRWLADSVWCAQ